MYQGQDIDDLEASQGLSMLQTLAVDYSDSDPETPHPPEHESPTVPPPLVRSKARAGRVSILEQSDEEEDPQTLASFAAKEPYGVRPFTIDQYFEEEGIPIAERISICRKYASFLVTQVPSKARSDVGKTHKRARK